MQISTNHVALLAMASRKARGKRIPGQINSSDIRKAKAELRRMGILPPARKYGKKIRMKLPNKHVN